VDENASLHTLKFKRVDFTSDELHALAAWPKLTQVTRKPMQDPPVDKFEEAEPRLAKCIRIPRASYDKSDTTASMVKQLLF